jgi:hypothetical protein
MKVIKFFKDNTIIIFWLAIILASIFIYWGIIFFVIIGWVIIHISLLIYAMIPQKKGKK